MTANFGSKDKDEESKTSGSHKKTENIKIEDNKKDDRSNRSSDNEGKLPEKSERK